MDEQTRRTGLDIIGDVPWGTHFCHFYRTKRELIDVLVPYFKAGLESNEFCLWVTSEPLVEQDARKAMSEAMPGFDRYLKTGQIEIMPHDRWYLKDNVFDPERVLSGWVDKLDSALSRGYSGLRLTGNAAWLEKKDWPSFADYEAAVTGVIGKHKMVALCSYWLEKCSAAEVIEAARSHAFAIVSHNGNPELVEGALYRQTREALAQLQASEERSRLLVENATEGIAVIQDGEIVFANPQVTEVIGHPEPGQPSRPITELIHPDDRQMVTERLLGVLGGQDRPGIFSFRIINKEGNIRWIEANMAPFTWNGRPAVISYVSDITDRKLTEIDLKIKDSAMATSINGIVILDLEGKVTYVNPSFLRIWGFDSEKEVLGKSLLEITDASQKAEAAALMRESRQKGMWQGVLEGIRFKDGARYAVLLSANTVTNEAGEPTHSMASFVDIADLKRTEEALRASEERNRLLIDNATEGILVLQDEKVVFHNAKYVEITGLPEEELMSMHFTELVHPDDRQIVTERYLKRLRGEEISPTYAIRGIDKAGNVKWVEATSALFTWKGRPAILALVTDATERKQAEEALQESEKRYRLLFDVTPVVTSITTPEGRALAVNNAIREISGYTPEEFVTLNMNDIYVDPGERRHMRTLLQREGRVRDFETVFRRKDGLICIVLLNADTIELDNQRLILATVRNITERKQAEEEIQGLLDSVAQERDKLSSLVNSITDEVWFADTQKNFTLVNPVALREFGYGSANPINVEEMARSLEVYRPDGSPRPVEEAPALRALRGEVVQNMEEIIRTPVRGELRYRQVSAAPVRDTSGNIIGSVSVVRDITDPKRAEEKLQRQQKHFRALIENASDAITIAGADGTISYESPSCERMSGFKPEERIGANIIERIHPDDLKLLSDTFSRLIRHPGSTMREEIRLRHKDGTWLTVEATVTNLLHDPAVNGIVVNLRDITERKQAEEALRKSHQLLNDTGEMAKVGGWELDLSTNEVSWTEEVGHIHGVGLVGYRPKLEEALNFYAPESRPAVEAAVKKAAETGEPWDIESLFIPRGSKDKIWVRSLGKAVYSGGEIVRLAGTFQNIDKYRRVEQALRESETRYRLLAENLSDVIWTMGTDLKYTYISPSVTLLRGYTVEEAMAQPLAENLTPASLETAMKLMVEEEAKERTGQYDPNRSITMQVEVSCKNGSTIWMENRVTYLRDSNGQIAAYLGISRDITESKRAEEELQESEQKLRAIFDNANDGFISVDPESGRLLNANRRMIQMLGYESEEEMKHLTISDIHPRENLPHILRESEKHVKRQISRSEDIPVKRKDGSIFFASVSSSPLIIADKTYLSCIYRDVTEHKQAEATREAFYRRLVDVQEKERQTIARELHDEIGQPLTVLKLYLDRNKPKTAADVDPQLEEARKVLLGLIHQVRNMSVNLRPTMLDELGLLPTLLWHFERYTRQTKISVNFRHTGLKQPLPPEVANTAYRLIQEGLTNVARHAQVSEVTVHIRARRKSLVIEVQDHGIGFDLSKVVGKGIGLTGMCERALALNGTLTIESTPGTGTYLLAELPLSKGSEKEIKTKKGSGKNSVNG